MAARLPEEQRWRPADPAPTPPHRMFTPTSVKERPVSQYAEPREIVQSFARRMEERLRHHDDDRPGWRGAPYVDAHATLQQVYSLLIRKMTDLSEPVIEGPGGADPEEVAHIAADAANYLMMIADLCGALAPEPLDAQGRQLPVGMEGP